MRWLVTGSTGMLGTDMVDLLSRPGSDQEVTGATRADLDLADPRAVAEAVAGHDVVVNCAGWTAVDDAETHEELAHRVNAEVPRLLARTCRQQHKRLVQMSTDYVFDGTATTPYPEEARLAPASAYGRTKAAGELAVREELPEGHLVVRAAWLYGAHGSCFPRTIARLARERGSVEVVADQVGQPTWTRDVAELIEQLVTKGARGTFHATSSGQCSWFEFARAVVDATGLDPDLVHPSTTDAATGPAPRPAYSVLGHGAFESVGIAPIGDLRERWRLASADVLPRA